MNEVLRSEYPRPDFVRKDWLSLNGTWEFSFDEEVYDRQIRVPFAYETELSGIHEKKSHELVWYRRKFTIPENMKGKQIIVHFGAVDYYCRIWVNDVMVKEHIGGQIGFSVNITDVIYPEGINTIRVQVKDDYSDLEMPRGKQFWEEESRSIFYTRTTGIWQSVWLEAVSIHRILQVHITPLLDEYAVRFEYELSEKDEQVLEAQINFQGTEMTGFHIITKGSKGSITIQINQAELNSWNFNEDLTWSPENPRLFDVRFKLFFANQLEDEVTSYFGMRKVSIDHGMFMLNNRPYYQKLLLDQGYWPESLLTAPSDEAFIRDIQLMKEMGFNGVRIHQKIEDPRFLYHADTMGLLVWGEIGNAYLYSKNYAKNMYQEWCEAVLRDYNHPCIVVWTPLNESWGIQEVRTNKLQEGHCNAMYHITKSLDSTRVVLDNDGWEHTCGDMLTIHDYEASRNVLEKRYETLENILKVAPCGRELYIPGWSYKDQPILVSECGGIDMHEQGSNGWGYSAAKTEEDFLKGYHDIVNTLMKAKLVQGFCYTQLMDVEQETNGLLTFDRRPKVSLYKIREINEGKN
ncbi:MAG: glycoside hydrolase family 2 sugar binding protein [Firmicutes bacterium]|nr:glycoside hydrolase family 2 sugar binding protein [Bacillota bacterium]